MPCTLTPHGGQTVILESACRGSDNKRVTNHVSLGPLAPLTATRIQAGRDVCSQNSPWGEGQQNPPGLTLQG